MLQVAYIVGVFVCFGLAFNYVKDVGGYAKEKAWDDRWFMPAFIGTIFALAWPVLVPSVMAAQFFRIAKDEDDATN